MKSIYQRKKKTSKKATMKDYSYITPTELRTMCKDFCKESPYKKNVFVMMRYGKQKYFAEIAKTIRDLLESYGLKARIAKDKAYSDDLWKNIKIYMHGSKYGIAVFEEIDEREYNPNISLELGYMYALKRRCLLLKEQRMRKLPTDVCGKLYKNFDQFNIKTSIKSCIEEWLKNDLGIAINKENEEIQPYLKILKDTNADVRMSAVSALSKTRSDKAVMPLSKALRDKDVKVRRVAATALGEIRSDKAVEPLSKALKDADIYVRMSAATALGEIRNYKAVESLSEALTDKDPNVRISAATALGRIGTDNAIERLSEALRHEDIGVQMVAEKFLQRIGLHNK